MKSAKTIESRWLVFSLYKSFPVVCCFVV